jgi:hypothetical protein
MGKAAATPRHHPLPHDLAIRSKLLNRLGIYKAVPVRNATTGERRKHVIRASNLATSSTAMHHRKSYAEPFRLPLNDNGELLSSSTSQHEPLAFSSPSATIGAASISPPSLSSTSSLAPPSDRCIQFENEVMVVPIPTRHEYSNRIKKFLWTASDELYESVERNRAEFAAEGWDWHSVLEDDDMYVDAQSGELVHPVWLQEHDLEEEEEEDAMMLDGELAENLPKLSRSPSLQRMNEWQ